LASNNDDAVTQLSTATPAASAGLIEPRRDWADVGFCITCGYALRGLPRPRCPECGGEFDPHDPRTMRVPGWKPPTHRAPPRVRYFSHEIVVAAFSASLALISCAWPIGVIGWTCVFIAWRRRSRLLKIHEKTGQKLYNIPEGRWPWRTLVTAIFLLTLWPGAFNDRCPHARYFGIGPLGVAYSDNGGPCHNHVNGSIIHLGGNWYFYTRE
jgi:hypothetical protein